MEPTANTQPILTRTSDAPIGIFDSGFGGLTVARDIAKKLPNESLIYLGDSARGPYGPRPLSEVDGFVQQIGSWLVSRGVKMIVIACNTATAAGLSHAQQTLPVPVIGVVEPGARAAAHATKNRRVGVIATKATVESDAYTKAIRHIDAGITVFSTATPRFVDIAEQGIKMAEGPIEEFTSLASKVYIRPAFQEIAQDYLDPLRRCEIDTLVLGAMSHLSRPLTKPRSTWRKYSPAAESLPVPTPSRITSSTQLAPTSRASSASAVAPSDTPSAM